MSFSTYTDLSTAIGTWGTRTYSMAQTDEFILIAEDRINSKLGPQYRRETTATISVDANGEGSLPTDFLVMRSFYRDNAGAQPLVPVSWRALRSLNAYEESGEPANYSVQGSAIKVAPITEGDYTADYWAKLAALGASNETNWLILAKPSVYLFYCRSAQAAFEEEFQQAAMFLQMGDEALEDFVAQGTVAQYATAEMVLEGVTP